jgi:hypothetical protein
MGVHPGAWPATQEPCPCGLRVRPLLSTNHYQLDNLQARLSANRAAQAKQSGGRNLSRPVGALHRDVTNCAINLQYCRRRKQDALAQKYYITCCIFRLQCLLYSSGSRSLGRAVPAQPWWTSGQIWDALWRRGYVCKRQLPRQLRATAAQARARAAVAAARRRALVPATVRALSGRFASSLWGIPSRPGQPCLLACAARCQQQQTLERGLAQLSCIARRTCNLSQHSAMKSRLVNCKSIHEAHKTRAR